MGAELGIIEGYYGRPWSWEGRAETVRFLKPYGYEFYLYAPKADPFLRKRWSELHPPQMIERLKALAGVCREADVRFGVGLSPYEIYRDFGTAAKDALSRKLESLDAVGVQQLGVFFDDMQGDLPDLARTQADILHFILERTSATQLIACPSYYSDDPVLDRIFGQRPAGYLETLGSSLDPSIDVFWTGEEVCSPEYSPGHLQRVSEQLRRKPVLWDNWPVNDGPRMSPFLHLRAFTGRPAAIGEHLAGHAVNPALQCVLSRIPAVSLAESYAAGDRYEYFAAFRRAAHAVLGEALGERIVADVGAFEDLGLNALPADRTARLRERYAAFDHEGAREVVKFLDRGYEITREMMEQEEAPQT